MKHWTTEQIAKVLGMTPQAINEAARQGYLPKAGRGQYDPTICIPKYIQYLKQRATSDRLGEERAKLAHQQSRKAEMEADRMCEKLADVDELRIKESRLLEGIAAIVRSSAMEDTRKEDIFSTINDHLDTWEHQ